MKAYRKRPVEIQAARLGFDINPTSAVKMIGNGASRLVDGRKVVGVIIPTLEGKMSAEIGDWIIRGVAGEYYPCKHEIFEQTYELPTPPETDNG